jgi:large subunit ribosomal protein L36
MHATTRTRPTPLHEDPHVHEQRPAVLGTMCLSLLCGYQAFASTASQDGEEPDTSPDPPPRERAAGGGASGTCRNGRVRNGVLCVPEQEATVKVRSSLRSLKQKPGATVVRRHGKTYVVDKVHPRFKARQG